MSTPFILATLAATFAAGYATSGWLSRLSAPLATLNDLEEMEDRMAIKLTELEGKVGALDAKVTKIWNEQQTKYDALVKLYEEVKTQLENVEVPAGAESAMTAFEAKLTAFDDTIPDTTA